MLSKHQRNCTIINPLLKPCSFPETRLPFKLINSRYAEIRYTQGGYEHLEMAKSYYSHAVRLNPNNMRALYGLLQV